MLYFSFDCFLITVPESKQIIITKDSLQFFIFLFLDYSKEVATINKFMGKLICREKIFAGHLLKRKLFSNQFMTH